MFFPYATIIVSIKKVFYNRENMYFLLKDNLLLCYTLVIFTRLIVSVRMLHKQAASSTVCSIFIALWA